MIKDEFIDHNSTLLTALIYKWNDYKKTNKYHIIDEYKWEIFIASLDIGIKSLGLVETHHSTFNTCYCHKYKIINKNKWLLTKLKYSI
jgi:hypothetical protein